MLTLSFLKELKNRLQQIEDRHNYLSFLIQERFANEKLLQLEAMHIISQYPNVVDYLPERLYNQNGKGKCDFWFRTSDGTEFWMEMKMRPTNYLKPGHAKAITNGVDQVIEDIQRLKNVKGNNIRRLMLFAFYPLYARNYSTFDNIHLKRINREIGRSIESQEAKVKVGQADFNIYLEEF